MKGNRLKGMILYKDKTEAEIAAKLGISKRAMTDRITGRVEFTASEIKIIAQILELTYSEINHIFFDE